MRARLKLPVFVLFVVLIGLLVLAPLFRSGGLLSAQEATRATYSQSDFIKKIAPTAQKLSENYGIKSSIIIGQAVLDSNYGATLLSSRYHNLYSIEAAKGEPGVKLTTSQYIDNQWRTVTKRYKVYDSWEESIYDYLARLRAGQIGDAGLYQSMASSSSYRTMARALQAAEFSTDPEYANELISIIEENKLTDYDK